MARQPGWYRNPEDSRSLRYWDGAAWSEHSRKRPPWSLRTTSFEVGRRGPDRSIEGPVHHRESRQTVASGAGRRQWAPWRPRPAQGPSAQAARALGLVPEAQARHAPSRANVGRRPVLVLACLVVIGIAVVTSSAAFIRPYETKGYVQAASEAAAARFAATAQKQCAAVVPRYRDVLAMSRDAPQVEAAARQVVLLARRLGSIPAAQGMAGPVSEWILKLTEYSRARALWAQEQGTPAGADAARLAGLAAKRADAFSFNYQLASCRLEPAAAS